MIGVYAVEKELHALVLEAQLPPRNELGKRGSAFSTLFDLNPVETV